MKSINTIAKAFLLILLFSSSVCMADGGGTKPRNSFPSFGMYENTHISLVDFKAVNQNQNLIVTFNVLRDSSLRIMTEKKAKQILKNNGFVFNSSVMVVVKYKGKILYKL